MTDARAQVSGDADVAALVASARTGSGGAMRLLYERMSPAVAGYLRAQGVPDAEAATNEVFFRGFTKLHRFRGDGGGFTAWVFTIAHNLAVDERRKAARRPRVLPATDAEALDRPAPDTETVALERLGLAAAAELLSQLTTAQRDVLFLRVIAGLSVGETAAVVGRPPGAVKALQHRGLAALRRLLADRGVTETASSTFPGMT